MCKPGDNVIYNILGSWQKLHALVCFKIWISLVPSFSIRLAKTNSEAPRFEALQNDKVETCELSLQVYLSSGPSRIPGACSRRGPGRR